MATKQNCKQCGVEFSYSSPDGICDDCSDENADRKFFANDLPSPKAERQPGDWMVQRAKPKTCRCGHPPHTGQCPAVNGCWCDTFQNESDLDDREEDPDRAYEEWRDEGGDDEPEML